MGFITEERFMKNYNNWLMGALENEDDDKMEKWRIISNRCLMSKIKRNGNIVKISIRENGYKDHYEIIEVNIIEKDKLGVIDTMRFSFKEILGENKSCMYKNGDYMCWQGKGMGATGNYLDDEEYESIASAIMNYICMYA